MAVRNKMKTTINNNGPAAAVEEEAAAADGKVMGTRSKQRGPDKISAGERREMSRLRHWRLIVRNLPFKTTSDDLRSKFQQYGAIRELVLPPCKDKKFPSSCAGYGFIQFANRSEADHAFQGANMGEFLGRKIAIDWAVPKDTYATAVAQEKSLSSKTSTPASKEQQHEFKSNSAKEDADSDSGPPVEMPIRRQNNKAKHVKYESSSSHGSESDSDDGSQADESKPVENSSQQPARPKLPRKPDAAVEEGRALFVRNLSFDTTNETLRAEFEQFGGLDLAIVCKYPGTEHSKGSGFLHYTNKADADKCLQQTETEDGVTLEGRRVYAHRALPKPTADELDKSRLEKHPKDNRNLHLLRICVIRPGTAQAHNMSEDDARKRANLELSTREKVKNLHMFVSPNRLIVHNLPKSVNDQQLRSICFMAADDCDAKIIEVNSNSGLGRSTGYGFVAFSEHSHALRCLKALNNNPTTFTDTKRPIVEFSIENKHALNIRQARIEKSKLGKRARQDTRTAPQTGRTFPSKRTKLSDLDDTKRTIFKSGMKPLPSHVGPKIRHRDNKTVNSGKRKLPGSSEQNGKKADKRSRKQVRSEKGRQKMVAKYLTMA